MKYTLERKSLRLEPETSIKLDLDEGTVVHSIRAKNSTHIELLLLIPYEKPDTEANE